MPNSIEIPKAIRITADNDEALLQFTSTYRGIWCKEEPDLEKHCNKIHYHGLIDTSLSDNGLRKQIYNFFETPKNLRGNPTCGFTKVTDREGALRYICKGTSKTYPNIVYNTYLGDEIGVHHSWMESDGSYLDEGLPFFPTVDYYYTKFWEINKQLHADVKKRREEKKTAKQNFKDYFVNDVIPEYSKNYSKLGVSHICLLMFRWYKEHDKELPSKTQGQIIVNDLYLRYICPEGNIEEELLKYYGFWIYDGR